MIRANDTPVRRNENIGTPTLALLKTGSRGVLQAVPPRAAAYSSVNPWTCPGVGAVVDVSHIRRSECLLQRE